MFSFSRCFASPLPCVQLRKAFPSIPAALADDYVDTYERAVFSSHQFTHAGRPVFAPLRPGSWVLLVLMDCCAWWLCWWTCAEYSRFQAVALNIVELIKS